MRVVVSRKLALGIALAGIILSASGPASAQNEVTTYAKSFVSVCSTALLGDAPHATRLQQAGFKRRSLKLSKFATVLAPKKPTNLCTLTFIRVFPRPEIMMAGITAELARQGFRSTGQIIPTANKGNPFGGTGASKRQVFSNGKQSITLETAGDGRSSSPVFGLQRLSK